MKTGKILKLCALLLAVTLCMSSCLKTIYTVDKSGKDVTSKGTEKENSSGTPENESGESNTREDKRISFLAVGDNMNHSSIFNEASVLASRSGVSGYLYDDMYADVTADIKKADIAFVNQEAPIAGDSYGITGHPLFNAPENAGETLVKLGFDIVNIANNHMLDKDNASLAGYLNSIKFWKSQNVTMIGGYENTGEYAAKIIERGGIKIALLSYTYGTNGQTVNPSCGCVVPYIDKDVIKSQIEAAKGNADLIFVSIHWGDEGKMTPNAEQTSLAKYIADLGADAIIGHHSHTIQPVEWIEGKDGNKMLCIYSLGNFICTMLYPYYILGGMCSFDIVKEADAEKPHIENVIYEPIVIHYEADAGKLDDMDLPTRTGVKIYYLKDYTEELASRHGAQLYQSFSLNTLNKYVSDTIDEEFLSYSK